MGKFTKTGKFKLHITALDHLAPHAKYKVWVKPNGEMPFLYGNHVLKAHVGRITEDCPEHQGVVVYSMNDTPLGFGVTARSTAETRKLDPTGIVVFRQADIGEYLRDVSAGDERDVVQFSNCDSRKIRSSRRANRFQSNFSLRLLFRRFKRELCFVHRYQILIARY